MHTCDIVLWTIWPADGIAYISITNYNVIVLWAIWLPDGKEQRLTTVVVIPSSAELSLLSAAALNMPLAAEMVSITVPTGMPYWSSVALLSYNVLRICSQPKDLSRSCLTAALKCTSSTDIVGRQTECCCRCWHGEVASNHAWAQGSTKHGRCMHSRLQLRHDGAYDACMVGLD